MVELLFEPTEEAHGGVAERAAFSAHGSGQFMTLADEYPSEPTAVAAAVGVDDGPLVGPECGAWLLEHGVGKLGSGGVSAGGSSDRHAVEAVNDGTKVCLARADAELGDVRDS